MPGKSSPFTPHILNFCPCWFQNSFCFCCSSYQKQEVRIWKIFDASFCRPFFLLRHFSSTGWSIRTVICNMALTNWKTPKQDQSKNKFKSTYWEVWYFIINLLWANKLFIKKNWHISCVNQWKVFFKNYC